MESLSSKEKILIVEDTKSIIDFISSALSERGYEVFCAINGAQALKITPKLQPSLILLDILMPEMDGYETCRLLKENELTKSIPIIFTSALSQSFDKVKAFQVGGVDYITKPIETEELLARIQTHLTISRLQKELENTNKILKESETKLTILNADKDRFISILAHDLKNPFVSLLGFSSLLVENIHILDIKKIESYAKLIYDTGTRVFHLLEDLLFWARSQSGKLVFEPQSISLYGICLGIVNDMRLVAKPKNISINYFIDENLVVYVDINMLNTILRNLISNAIKYTNKDGQVEIRAEQNNSNIIITIKDNGIGIKPDRINNLFVISQIQSTRGTAEEEGSGLGLLLCKDFVEKHGGKIWVESEIGKGSEFKFTLPF